MTSLDFVLRGYMKTKVYKTKVDDIVALKERIEQEMKALKKETLENVFHGLIKRLNCYIDVNGDTFEQLMPKLLVSNKILNISLSLKKKGLLDLVKK